MIKAERQLLCCPPALLCVPAPSVCQDSPLGIELPDKGGCYASSAQGSASRWLRHGSPVSASVPPTGTRCSIAGTRVGSPHRLGRAASAHPGPQPAPLGPRSPPLPGPDRGMPRPYSFSCKTHTCSGSAQVCILKITTVWREKESLFYD